MKIKYNQMAKENWDLSYVSIDAKIYSPSPELLGELRKNKLQGLMFGLFFTLLSIAISILTSNIFYFFLALMLFMASILSVSLSYIQSELKFNSLFIMNREGIGMAKRNRVVFFHSYGQISHSLIVHSIKGNLDYYSIFFVPIGLQKASKRKEATTNWDRIKERYESRNDGSGKKIGLRFLKKYYTFSYLDMELAVKIENEFVKSKENNDNPFHA